MMGDADAVIEEDGGWKLVSFVRCGRVGGRALGDG